MRHVGIADWALPVLMFALLLLCLPLDVRADDEPLLPISSLTYDGLGADVIALDEACAATCDPVAIPSVQDDCWLFSDQPLLHDWRNRPLHDDWKYSIGGEFRWRGMDERNRLRPMGTATRDIYDLWRFAPFLQIGNDTITAYVQGIDASIFDHELAPVAIDENRSDLLQYYVDLRLSDPSADEELRLKAGRQFLNYGSQRLISPLAWSNTYRNFEGARLYYADDDWKVDGFATRPVNGAAIPLQYRPESRDRWDSSFWLSGLYATYKQAPLGTVDLYWIWSLEEERLLARQDGNRHTLGIRYDGKLPVESAEGVQFHWVWDAEAAWQFGEDSFDSGGIDQDVNAGFATIIGGISADQAPLKPTLKGIFWWGSGDGNPNDGRINTVTTLFPLGHAYWGMIDNLNGANLLDFGVQATISPLDKLTLLAAWHHFDKADRNDFIYNVAGAHLGTIGATGSRHIGNELDLMATYQINANLQVQAGYFWFWYGNAVNDDPGLVRNDAQQFYLMTTWGF